MMGTNLSTVSLQSRLTVKNNMGTLRSINDHMVRTPIDSEFVTLKQSPQSKLKYLPVEPVRHRTIVDVNERVKAIINRVNNNPRTTVMNMNLDNRTSYPCIFAKPKAQKYSPSKPINLRKANQFIETRKAM